MTTFEIKDSFRKLEEMMNEFDQETGEFIYSTESLSHFVIELEEKRELKLNNIEDLKREYKSRNDSLDVKIKSLQARKKQTETQIHNLKFFQEVLLNVTLCLLRHKFFLYFLYLREFLDLIELCSFYIPFFLFKFILPYKSIYFINFL